jgi:hypothetical protein
MLLTKEEYNDCIDAIKPLLLSGKATTDDYWYKAVCKAQAIKIVSVLDSHMADDWGEWEGQQVKVILADWWNELKKGLGL